MRIIVALSMLLAGANARAETCTTVSNCITAISKKPNCATVVCTAPSNQCEFQHVDDDGDGHAPPCTAPAGYAFVDLLPADDCDDNDPTVHPGAWDGPAGVVAGVDEPNRCDGRDHDCNGTPNDGKVTTATGTTTCTCTPGQVALCNQRSDGTFYNVPPNTQCAYGVRQCLSTGAWDVHCFNGTPPAAADTCRQGDDSNCNGIPNEGSPCIAGNEVPCPFAHDPKQNYCGGHYICQDDCSVPTQLSQCTITDTPMCPFGNNQCSTTQGDPPIEFNLLDSSVISGANSNGVYFFPLLDFGQTYGATAYLSFVPEMVDCGQPSLWNAVRSTALITADCDQHRTLQAGDFLATQQPDVITDTTDPTLSGWPTSRCLFSVGHDTVEKLLAFKLSTCTLRLNQVFFKTTRVQPNCPEAFKSNGPCGCYLGARHRPTDWSLVVLTILVLGGLACRRFRRA